VSQAPRRSSERDLPSAIASSLPRWRGFNLVEKFAIDLPERNTTFRESDFDVLARWGFDFVRLPMDYRTWTEDGDLTRFREPVLAEIDRAVEWGRQYGVHVSINFHRAPGYCVNRPLEPTDLWTHEPTQEACAFHWAAFAERYRGIPNERVSFNLLNEPMNVDEAVYKPVIERLVAAIRERDPDRLIVADGLDLGWTPAPGLAGLGIAQSLHAYDPWRISHYRAPWFPQADTWPVPTWPLATEEGVRDRDALRRERIEPWRRLERTGVGVHVGEFGTFNRTPHDVTLTWMEDCLRLFHEVGWGWCVWNLRGAYGPLDSDRTDVDYEDFEGHRLDRRMLELLRRY
jgi:endoglucanase